MSGLGRAGRPCSFSPKGRAERWAFYRARGTMWRAHGTRVQKHTVKTNNHGSGSTPASRTRMVLSACCMPQGASLALTPPRSCELSPGHALGPSAHDAGVSLERGPASVRPTASRIQRIDDDRDAPSYRSGMEEDIFLAQFLGQHSLEDSLKKPVQGSVESGGGAQSVPQSLRGAQRRSNPDLSRRACGNSDLDCFASLAMTKLEARHCVPERKPDEAA